jgi:hypothetical protein
MSRGIFAEIVTVSGILNSALWASLCQTIGFTEALLNLNSQHRKQCLSKIYGFFGSYRGIFIENLFLDEAPTSTFMGDKDSLVPHLGHFPS